MKDAPRRRPLRRQGAEPAQPRPQLLAEAGAGRRGPPDPERHRPGRRRRGDPDRLRVRGAPPRGQPHQALPAALQRPAQGRQELPVHQDHPRPTTSRASSGRASWSTTAAATSGRTPRPRSVDESMNLIRRLFPFRTCTIDIKDGERALPAALPPVPHQALPGPVHRGDLEGRLPARHRPDRALPRGPPGDALVKALDAARWTPPPSGPTTSGPPSLRDKVRAIERTMESQKMAAFARTELDLHRPRPAGQPGCRPALRRSATAR